MQYYLNGLILGLINLILALFFDLINIKVVQLIQIKLYIKAIIYNTINLILISPIVYSYILTYYSQTDIFGIKYEIINTILIVFFQGIFYHIVHKLMHTRWLYKIHKFHHKFNKYVIPMSANAVSIYEFLFAYLLPIIIPIYFLHPSHLSINIAIFVISLGNILIHSPIFLNISQYVPDMFVSTEKHIDHHKHKDKHFSAPIINFDSIF